MINCEPIEKSHKDAQDNGPDVQLISSNKKKGSAVLDDVDTSADDELSLGSSPSLTFAGKKKLKRA